MNQRNVDPYKPPTSQGRLHVERKRPAIRRWVGILYSVASVAAAFWLVNHDEGLSARVTMLLTAVCLPAYLAGAASYFFLGDSLLVLPITLVVVLIAVELFSIMMVNIFRRGRSGVRP